MRAFLRRLLFPEGVRCALIAGLAVLPGFAGAATLVVFFVDWPHGDGAAQLGVGAGAGLVAWWLFSRVFLRGFARPQTADPDIYDELRARVISLRAQIPAGDGLTPKQREARSVAREHKAALSRELCLEDDAEEQAERACDSCLRWLLAYGYVNLWRQVSRAEEALLEFGSRDELYLAAITDRARLRKSSIAGRDVLLEELDGLIGDGKHRHAATEGEVPARFEEPRARALLRETRYTLNKYRDELWDELVRLRNLLFATMVVTGIASYALLGLAVVRKVDARLVAAAVAFYLVGVVVGLFGELRGVALRKSGVVNDYGLGLVRLMTVPLLSGIAAVGGVLVTRLGAAATDGVPPLDDIFRLGKYPTGLVIAAIFGLTPGLFLERLRARTDEYKKDIASSGVGGETPPASEPPAP